jgi:hypothetical protein
MRIETRSRSRGDVFGVADQMLIIYANASDTESSAWAERLQDAGITFKTIPTSEPTWIQTHGRAVSNIDRVRELISDLTVGSLQRCAGRHGACMNDSKRGRDLCFGCDLEEMTT